MPAFQQLLFSIKLIDLISRKTKKLTCFAPGLKSQIKVILKYKSVLIRFEISFVYNKRDPRTQTKCNTKKVQK